MTRAVDTSVAATTSVADGTRAADDAAANRLPLGVRDDLADVGERVAWLLRFGRKVRIVPLLFVLVWPFVLPALLRQWRLAWQLLQRDDVQAALQAAQGIPFELGWNDEHDDALPTSTLRDLVLLQPAMAVFAVSVVGPLFIIIGFVVALLVAGR